MTKFQLSVFVLTIGVLFGHLITCGFAFAPRQSASPLDVSKFGSSNSNNLCRTAASPTGEFESTNDATFKTICSDKDGGSSNRRSWLHTASLSVIGFASVSVVAASISPLPAYAAPDTSGSKSFAPGGTLVDYQVGVTVGNSMASKSRKPDNSNVIFNQDYYYKFGTAPQFIDNGSTEFPKTMPFTAAQQRYDTMKKYRERVQRGIDLIVELKGMIEKGDFTTIADGSSPEYSIRPMGLLANGFLASENTGTTNELLLARWYINEIYLDINDIKAATSKDDALQSHAAAVKALNSLLGMINRVTNPKVGDPFPLV
jgi:hypothetical protein